MYICVYIYIYIEWSVRYVTFNSRLKFEQLHEVATSQNQLCSELHLRQSRFHLTLCGCLQIFNVRYRKKTFYMVI